MTAPPETVILYGPPWDAPAQVSKHHLARYWSTTRPVLYVEAPPNPASFLTRPAEARRMLRRYLGGPVQIDRRLWVGSYLYALPYHGRGLLGGRWVNDLNQAVIRPQLRRTLAALGFHHPVVVVGGAHALPLLDALSPRLVVYHCSDDYTRQANFPPSFAAVEEALIQRCDVVVATSAELARAKQHLRPGITVVRNGVDVEHFAQASDPRTVVAPELQTLLRPIVGYIGTVFEWIDQDLIAWAARRRPSWTFVFVGPVTTSVQRLRGQPNVHLLGPQSYRVLPQYLRGFDVAIIPFVFHDVTLRASPIKFYEYLASGVPVVASRLPDFEALAHLTRLVRTPEEFLQAVEASLADTAPAARARRMSEARGHSWDARFAVLDDLIAGGLAASAPVAVHASAAPGEAS